MVGCRGPWPKGQPRAAAAAGSPLAEQSQCMQGPRLSQLLLNVRLDPFHPPAPRAACVTPRPTAASRTQPIAQGSRAPARDRSSIFRGKSFTRCWEYGPPGLPYSLPTSTALSCAIPAQGLTWCSMKLWPTTTSRTQRWPLISNVPSHLGTHGQRAGRGGSGVRPAWWVVAPRRWPLDVPPHRERDT